MKSNIEIIHEDASILVVNKPAGLLSAPDRYDEEAPVVAKELEPDFGDLWPVILIVIGGGLLINAFASRKNNTNQF